MRIYRLDVTDGDSPYEFRPIAISRTTRRYCNAELALAQVLHLALGTDFGGVNDSDGCVTP